MAKIIDSHQPVHDGQVVVGPGILTVSLESLTATPPTIAPFEATVIAWRVTSPTSVVPQVRINGQAVAAVGSMTVRPRSASTYRLSAKVGSSFTELGRVNVAVDTAACESGGITSVEPIMSRLFQDSIEQDPELYFTTQTVRRNGVSTVQNILPTVKADEAGLDLSLRFRKRLNNKPDPKIKADIRFNWVVVDGVIEPHVIEKDISIRFPLWFYAIPGAVPGLLIASGMGADSVLKNILDGLRQFAARLLQPPDGRRPLSVRVSSALEGSILTEHCPEPAL